MGESKTTTVTEVVTTQKSRLVAFLLWLLLGWMGAHRYYCGRVGTGVLQLVLAILGYVTLVFYIGAVFFLILGIWLLVDLIRILTGSLVTGTVTQKRTVTTKTETR